MENIATSIPFTAWQQAVFVVLFIVMVIGLLYWFTKQQDKWQRFIAEINEKWQKFSADQRKENNVAMTEVKEAVSDLTTVTQGLVSEVKEMREASLKFYDGFEAHDKQARDILSAVQNAETKPIQKAAKRG